MTAVAVLLLVIEILMIKVIKNINNTKYDNIYNDDDDIQNNTKGYQISKLSSWQYNLAENNLY